MEPCDGHRIGPAAIHEPIQPCSIRVVSPIQIQAMFGSHRETFAEQTLRYEIWWVWWKGTNTRCGSPHSCEHYSSYGFVCGISSERYSYISVDFTQTYATAKHWLTSSGEYSPNALLSHIYTFCCANVCMCVRVCVLTQTNLALASPVICLRYLSHAYQQKPSTHTHTHTYH